MQKTQSQLRVATRRATQTANSYVAVDYADHYFYTSLDELWDALFVEEKEAALIIASQYLDGHYRFIGKTKSPQQFLAWPRVGAVDSDGRLYDGIPERLKQACCELALASALTGLDLPLTKEDFVLSASQRVGDIETKVQYIDGKPIEQVLPKVDALLKFLITQSANAFILKFGTLSMEVI